MGRHIDWQDEYWLLLIQLYLRKPQGVKHLYSRRLVDIALELHIHPRHLHRRMFRLRQIDTPRLQKLWDEYATNPRKLRRGVALLRRMNGFGNADAFYAGVEVNESWETDFKPIGQTGLTPVALIMILDLYFRLTPLTMVPGTPEVVEMARLVKSTPREVVAVMDDFMLCDPYMTKKPVGDPALSAPCREIWQRFANDDPEKLAELAAQLKEYFTLR